MRFVLAVLWSKPVGVPGDVLGHEGRDEEIGMVVAFLHADRRVDPRLFTSLLEPMGLQLLFKEIVS